MGQGAIKKRRATSKARKAAKSASGEPSGTDDVPPIESHPSVIEAHAGGSLPPIPEVEEAPAPLLPRVKLLPPAKPLAPPISTRSRSHSSSTPVSTYVIPSALPLPVISGTNSSDSSRPKRKSAEVVDVLLHQMRVNHALADDPGSGGDTNTSTAVDDSFEESDDALSYSEEDGDDELEYLDPPPKPAVAAVAPKPSKSAAVPKAPPKAAPKAAAKRKEKKVIVEVSDEEISVDDDGVFAVIPHLAASLTSSRSDTFTITLEVISMSAGIRAFEILHSDITLLELHSKVARILNVYAGFLDVQYRLSTDEKTAIPCNLATDEQFNGMMGLLRIHLQPPLLKNGKRSTKKMKIVNLQVFRKGDGPFSDTKVIFGRRWCISSLTITAEYYVEDKVYQDHQRESTHQH
jgi:hypothetical protein